MFVVNAINFAMLFVFVVISILVLKRLNVIIMVLSIAASFSVKIFIDIEYLMQCYQRIDFLEKWVFMLEPFTKTSSTLIMGYAFQRYLCVFPSEKWKKFDTTIFSIVYVVTFSIVAYGWNGGVYIKVS